MAECIRSSLEWESHPNTAIAPSGKPPPLMHARSSRYQIDLVRRLCALPHETEWVEFKGNYKKPELIGQ